MSKVTTFSRSFPSYHPKSGNPTFFVENIQHQFGCIWLDEMSEECQKTVRLRPKKHTVRKGSCFKAGEKFSPRIWSGVPYKSKQKIFCPDIEVKKVWDITINFAYELIKINNKEIDPSHFEMLAHNDGLTFDEFESWFGKKLFQGQIICWDDDVQY